MTVRGFQRPESRSPPLAGIDAADAVGTDASFPRRLARGQAYVYVLGCREDTLLKIGFSRDPLQRFRTLHSRFFEFFDLDGGLLVRTERVAQARRLERDLHAAFGIHQAPAPVIVPDGAAGHTEWFRGVLAEAVEAAREHALDHAFVHERPAAWLSSLLTQRADLLFDWAAGLFEAIEYAEHNQGGAGADIHARALRDALDAYRSVGIDPHPLLPAAVVRWDSARANAASPGATPDDADAID